MSFKKIKQIETLFNNIRYLSTRETKELLDGTEILPGEFEAFSHEVLEYLEDPIIKNQIEKLEEVVVALKERADA